MDIEVILSQHEFLIWYKTVFKNQICIKRQYLTAQYSTEFSAVWTYLMSDFFFKKINKKNIKQ